MNSFFKLILLLILFFASRVLSIEAEIGKWNFFKEEDYCFIISLPLKEEGNYDPSNRGDTYIMVYRINNNPEPTLQINAGYNYDKDKSILIDIDNIEYELFSEGDDSAWSRKEEDKIIIAMKKGHTLILKGISTRGTLTKDTYTLKGFTVSYKKTFKRLLA